MNLLLEGDDLEALLLQAHQEGGNAARIVRAEKVRRGGLFGFFARQGFEVAVEIPDPGPPVAAGPADGPAVADQDPIGPPPLAAGLLDLAERVSAAEQAAAGAVAEQVAADRAEFEPEPVETAIEPAGSTGSGTTHAEFDGIPRFRPAEFESVGADVVDDDAVGAHHGRGGPETPEPVPVPVLAADFEPAHFDRLPDPPPASSGTPDRPVSETIADTYLSELSMANSTDDPADDREPPWREQATVLPGRPRWSFRRLAELAELEPVPGPGETADGSSVTELLDQPGQSTRPGKHRPDGPRHRIEWPAGETETDGHLPDDALLDALPEAPGAALPEAPWAAEGAGGALASIPRPRSAPAGESWADVLRSATDNRQAAGRRIERRFRQRGLRAAAVDLAENPTESPAESLADPLATGDPDRADGSSADSGGRLPLPRTSLEAPTREPAAAGAVRPDTGTRVASDREGLQVLGVPAAWARRMPAGDRFSGVLAVLEELPPVAIDPATPAVAVIGRPGMVELEAHRTALDMPVHDFPRQVVIIPGGKGEERRAALSAARHTRPVSVGIQIPDYDDPGTVTSILTEIGAPAVIAVIEAGMPVERTRAWLRSLGQVDAVAVDGALDASNPAAVLGLDLPVVRLDGIPVDRVGWAALLCAQLSLLVG